MNVFVSRACLSVTLEFADKKEQDEFLTKLGMSMETDAQASADTLRNSGAFAHVDPSECLEGS